jgi:hypothetical protein
MENKGTNEFLLKVIHSVSRHYKIEGVEAVSFKKRSKLLEKLKTISEPAWQVTTDMVEAQLRIDRIITDKEKQQKNPEVWNTELEAAKTNKEGAAERLAAFIKSEGISTGGLEIGG